MATEQDQIFLSTGIYAYGDLPRYADHPYYASRDQGPYDHLDLFLVRCRTVGREDTGAVDAGSTAVTAMRGCDGRPGSSGSAGLLSRDGGKTYAVVGVRNSGRPGTEYNNDTRIEGAFAAHLSAFVDLQTFPEANGTRPLPVAFPPGGPWVTSLAALEVEAAR